MIGGDGISEESEAVSILDGSTRRGNLLGHALEERRVMDISRVVRPGEEITGWGLKVVPSGVSCKGVTIEVLEKLGSDNSLDGLGNFISARPDVSKEDRVAILVVTKGFLLEINIHFTGKSVGDDKGRTGEVVSSGVRMDSALEVSVTGEDGSSNKVVGGDGLSNAFREVSRVSNTGHATVSSSCETKLVKVLVDLSDLEVLGDDTRSGGE